jgi:translation elongation factor Ts
MLIKPIALDHLFATCSSNSNPLRSFKTSKDEAAKILREKGIAAASKKASRRAAEGLVGIAATDTAAALVEINSETDFVSRNDKFKALVTEAAEHALKTTTTSQHHEHQEQLDTSSLGMSQSVSSIAAVVRENIQFRRALRIKGDIVGTYIHAAVAPNLGRIAGVVSLSVKDTTTTSSSQQHKELAHRLAMHVVAALPRYLDRSSVPDQALNAEKEVLRTQAAGTGKSPDIIEKIAMGRLQKFYEDNCLMDQKFIMDDSKRVKEMLEGQGVKIEAFYRMQVGEGMESDDENGGGDFVSEVNKLAQS